MWGASEASTPWHDGGIGAQRAAPAGASSGLAQCWRWFCVGVAALDTRNGNKCGDDSDFGGGGTRTAAAMTTTVFMATLVLSGQGEEAAAAAAAAMAGTAVA